MSGSRVDKKTECSPDPDPSSRMMLPCLRSGSPESGRFKIPHGKRGWLLELFACGQPRRGREEREKKRKTLSKMVMTMMMITHDYKLLASFPSLSLPPNAPSIKPNHSLNRKSPWPEASMSSVDSQRWAARFVRTMAIGAVLPSCPTRSAC